MSAAFSFGCKKTEMFLKVMWNKEEGLNEGNVRSGKELVTIPAGQTKAIKCNVRTGPLPERQDVLFEPTSHFQLPEALEVLKSVVRLQ